MSEQIKSIFGVNDKDKSLRSKSSGGFGLNQGFITKIEFNPNAGKDGSPANAVDIHVQIDDKEYRRRLYETTGELYGKNNTKLKPGDEGYQEKYNEDMTQKVAVIKHALKAVGVTDDQIDSKMSNVTSVAAGLEALVSLAPSDLSSKKVDIFLEYQWQIASGQDKTYLELPKNMKGGYFLIPVIKPVGSWKEVKNEDGLKYTDDAGNVHPFDRNATFMESNKAIQQGVGVNNAQNMVDGEDSASSSTW